MPVELFVGSAWANLEGLLKARIPQQNVLLGKDMAVDAVANLSREVEEACHGGV